KQNEELEAWRGNLEQDLDAAQRTQRSLIPATPPALPGWEIAGFYRPVIQVGGDIYGWLRMRDGRILFWIADATGHGAAAALLTTLAKLLFHHANAENETPAEIMRAVDRDFRSILGARSFMTAMCVALDPQSGAGRIVGAGHPPVLSRRMTSRHWSSGASKQKINFSEAKNIYCPARCFGFNQRSCRKPKPKSPNASRTPHSCAPSSLMKNSLPSLARNHYRVPSSRKNCGTTSRNTVVRIKRSEPKLMPMMRFVPFSTAKVRSVC